MISNKVDKSYWGSELPLPLSPSDDDVKFFQQNMLEGSSLLLGCTKKLIPITDFQMDIDPWYDGPNVIIQDWLLNSKFYTNILGDGVFNFTPELMEGILKMASDNCKKLIIRSFSRKLPIMRIASNFPSKENFLITPTYTYSFQDYNFFIWEF